MAARLTQIRLKNFKSIGEEQTIDLRPLTVLIGRNNSGKSTVIQSLLLLKQTLEDPRREVQLSLQGRYVRAPSLRDLTHGWPENMEGKGPEITLQWTSEANGRMYDRVSAAKNDIAETRMGWLANEDILESLRYGAILQSEMTIQFSAFVSGIRVDSIELNSSLASAPQANTSMCVMQDLGGMLLQWKDGRHGSWGVEFDHFIPYLRPFHGEEQYDADDHLLSFAFTVLHEEPLRALNHLLKTLTYIGTSREEVPPYYARPTGLPSRSMLPTGGNAPELLYSRQRDHVHYSHLPRIHEGQHFELTPQITVRSLKDATDEVLRYLGIDGDLAFENIHQIGGFFLRLGKATLDHVGRGISSILPVVVAGLVADPLLGEECSLRENNQRREYLNRCSYNPCIALEEIESHLHPKAQTRLAHFMVALALSGRQLLVETHSDHLVRRLRGLVARAAPGSETERWLLENIGIVEVEQNKEGATELRRAELTREGSIEKWPADFMDESADEERAIYFAGSAKSPPEPPPADEGLFEDEAPPPQEDG